MLYMGHQFGEEGVEVVPKGGLVLLENRHGAGQVEGAAEPATNAAQDVGDALDRVVCPNPVFIADAMKPLSGLRGEFWQARFDISVELGNELGQENIAVLRPIAGQKMVEVNVREDACVAAIGSRKALYAGIHPRMRIGKTIDLAVLADASLKGLRKIG